MKKLYYLIILTVILGLVLTGCLLSNVGQVPTNEQSGITYLTKGIPGDPDVFTLYAGQDIDVGTVSVWNDAGDYLYVRYNTTGNWVMTETHLHVATSSELIPQKNGNPIPGKFDYKGEHVYETEVLYEIPLTWGPATELFIAAHAKVIRPIEDCWETVWQIGDVEVDDGTGHLTNYCDEFNYDGYYEGLGVLYPPFTNPFVVGTTLTNEFPWLSLGSYATDFNVHWFGELPFGGKLTVSWSPGASATETKIIMSIDDGVPFTFVVSGFTDPSGWRDYPLVQSDLELNPIGSGSHEIRFQHTTGDGAIWDWVLLEKPCVQEESAWAVNEDGIGFLPFPGKNWATYFMYNLEEIFVETVTVYPDGANHCSLANLGTGKEYHLDVSGTYRFGNWGDSGIADAKYSLRPEGSFNPGPGPQWISGDDLPSPWENFLELWVDGDPQAWGTLNMAHTYSTDYTGDGTSVCFSILDSAYGDNSGSLSVDITWIP